MGAVPSRESHEDPSSVFFANCGNIVVLHIPLTRHFFPSPQCQAFRQLREARNNQSALYSFDVRRLDEWLPGAAAEAFRAAQARDHGEEVAEEDPSMHYFDYEIENAQWEEIGAQARALQADGGSEQNIDDELRDDDRPRMTGRDSSRCRGEVFNDRQRQHVELKSDGVERPPRCSIESLKGLYTYLVVDAMLSAPVSDWTQASQELRTTEDGQEDTEAHRLERIFERQEADWVRSPWVEHHMTLADTNSELCARYAREREWQTAIDAWRHRCHRARAPQPVAKDGADDVEKDSHPPRPLSPTSTSGAMEPPVHTSFLCPIPEALAVRLSAAEVQTARRQFRQRTQSSPDTLEADEVSLCTSAESVWPAPIPPGHILRRSHRFERDTATYKDGRLHLVEEDGVLYFFAMNPDFTEPSALTKAEEEVMVEGVPLSDFVLEPCPHTVLQYRRVPLSSSSGQRGARPDDAADGEDERNGAVRAEQSCEPRYSDSATHHEGDQEVPDVCRTARRGSCTFGQCERCGTRVARRLDATTDGIPFFPSPRQGAEAMRREGRYLVPITPVRIVGVHGAVPARARGSPWLRGLEDAPEVDAYLENTRDASQRPPVLRLCRFIEGAIGEKILNRATLVTLLTYRLLCQRAGLADALVRPVWSHCTLSNIPFLQMVRETFFRARAAVAEIDDKDHTLRDWIEQFDRENNFMCFINRNLSTVRDYAPPERQLRAPATSAGVSGASVPVTKSHCDTNGNNEDVVESHENTNLNAVRSDGEVMTRDLITTGARVEPESDAVAKTDTQHNEMRNEAVPLSAAHDGEEPQPGTGDDIREAHTTSTPSCAPRQHARSRLPRDARDDILDAEAGGGEKGAIGRPDGHIPRDAEENGEDVYNEDDLSNLVVPPEKPTFYLFSSRLEPHAPVSIYTLFEHDIQQDNALPPEALPGYVQRDLLDANQRRQEQPRDTRRPSHALYDAGMRQSTRGRQLLFQLRADCVFALMYYCSQAAAPIFIGAYIEPVDTTPLSYGGAVRLVEPRPPTHKTSSIVQADPEFAQLAPLDEAMLQTITEYFLEKELITVFSVSDSTTWARGPDAAHSLSKLLLPAPVDPESALGKRQAEELRLYGHVSSYAVGDFRDADLVVYNHVLRCWEHYEHVQIRRRFSWTAQQQQQQQPPLVGTRSDRSEVSWCSGTAEGVDDDDGADVKLEPGERRDGTGRTSSSKNALENTKERIPSRNADYTGDSRSLDTPPRAARGARPPATLMQRQQRAIEAAGVSGVAPQDPASMSARLLCVGLDELLLSWTKWVVDNRFYEDRNDPGWLRLNLNAPWPPSRGETGELDSANATSAGGVGVHTLVRRGRYFIWSFRHNEERYFYGVIPKFAKDRLRRQKTHFRQRKKKAAAAAAAAVASAKRETETERLDDGHVETARETNAMAKAAVLATHAEAKASTDPPRRAQQCEEDDDEGHFTVAVKNTPQRQQGQRKKAAIAAQPSREVKQKNSATAAVPQEVQPSSGRRGQRTSSTGAAVKTPADSWSVVADTRQGSPNSRTASPSGRAAHMDPFVSVSGVPAQARERPRPASLQLPSVDHRQEPGPPTDVRSNAPPSYLPHQQPQPLQPYMSPLSAMAIAGTSVPSSTVYSSYNNSGSSPHWSQITSSSSPNAPAPRAFLSPPSSVQTRAPAMPSSLPYTSASQALAHATSPTISTPTLGSSAFTAGVAPHANRLLPSTPAQSPYGGYAPPAPTQAPFVPRASHPSPPPPPPPQQQQQASLAYHRNGLNTFMQANKRHENEYYPPLPTNPQQRVFQRTLVQQQPNVAGVGGGGGYPHVQSLSSSVGLRLAPGTPSNSGLVVAISANSSPPESGRSTPRVHHQGPVHVRVRSLKSSSTHFNSSGAFFAAGGGPGSRPSTPVGSYTASSYTTMVPGSSIRTAPVLGTSFPDTGAKLICAHEEEEGRLSPTSLLPPNLIQDGSRTKGESYLRTETNPEQKEMRSAFRWNPYSRHK